MNITKLEELANEKQIPLSTAIIAFSSKVSASKLFLATLYDELPGAAIYKIIKSFNNIYSREEKVNEVLSDYSIVYSTLLKAYNLHNQQSKQIAGICCLANIPHEFMLQIFANYEALCKKFEVIAKPKKMEDLEIAQLIVALNCNTVKVITVATENTQVMTLDPFDDDESYEELITDGNSGANQLHTQDCFVIPKPVKGVCAGATRVNYNTLKVFTKLYPSKVKKESFKKPGINVLETAKVISLKDTSLFFEEENVSRDFNASSASIKTNDLMQNDRDDLYHQVKRKVECNELGNVVRSSFYSAEIFWANGDLATRFLLNKDGVSYATNKVNEIFYQKVGEWMLRIKDDLTSYPDYKRFTLEGNKLINNEAGWEEEISLHICKVISDDIFVIERNNFLNKDLPRYNKAFAELDIDEISVSREFIVTHPLSNEEFDINEGNDETLHIMKNFFDSFIAMLKSSTK